MSAKYIQIKIFQKAKTSKAIRNKRKGRQRREGGKTVPEKLTGGNKGKEYKRKERLLRGGNKTASTEGKAEEDTE